MSYDVCMKQMLTTKSLDSMPPATAKRYEVRDQKVIGLHVRVSTTGAKVFYTMVRPNGARKRVKIGPFSCGLPCRRQTPRDGNRP